MRFMIKTIHISHQRTQSPLLSFDFHTVYLIQVECTVTVPHVRS